MAKKTIILVCIGILFISCIGVAITEYKTNIFSGYIHESNNYIDKKEKKGKVTSGGEANKSQVLEKDVYSSGKFIVKSSEVLNGEKLPITYTCDGSSSLLPISWDNSPENTSCYAVIMSHFSPDLDIHSYMVRYDIPGDLNSLLSDSEKIGSWGVNTVNRLPEYAPPCSKGPGDKIYTYTVYALSTCSNISGANLTREQVINSMVDNVLDSATLNVIYSR